MPTGYTAIIEDGDGTTFRGYALRCARAFGALVTLRDDSLDGDLPEKIEPSDYYEKALEKERRKLAELLALSLEECGTRAELDHRKFLKDWEDYRRSNALKLSRYESIRAEVEAWTPPTSEHFGAKKFMLAQIDLCLPQLRDDRYWHQPLAKTGEAWRREKIKEANDDISYHIEEGSKERERCEQATEWLRAYVASLPVVKG